MEEAYQILEKYYDTTDENWKSLSAELPTIMTRYKTPFWGNLVLAIVEHLNNKWKYEKNRRK